MLWFLMHFVIGLVCSIILVIILHRQSKRKFPELTGDFWSEFQNVEVWGIIIISLVGGLFTLPVTIGMVVTELHAIIKGN